jgi:hypothetical protein
VGESNGTNNHPLIWDTKDAVDSSLSFFCFLSSLYSLPHIRPLYRLALHLTNCGQYTASTTHLQLTMVTTQSFRLTGKPDLKEIVCDQIDGENVVFWEDIEQVFPGIKYITNGNTVVSMMRDSNRKR